MKKKINLLVLLLIITLQIAVFVWLLSVPKYTYISYNKLSNMVHNRYSANEGDIIPDIMLYKDGKHYNLHKNIRHQKNSYIIIDNCPCKRDLVDKYITNSSKTKTPVVYVYLKKDGYKKDSYEKENKYVTKYMCSIYDILNSFDKKEINDFPIVYYVNKEGLIIAKDM